MSTIELDYGASAQIDGTWKDSSGTALDLTGATSSLLVDETGVAAIALVTAASGTFKITVTAANVLTLQKGKLYDMRIKMTLPGGTVKTSPLFGVLWK